MKDATEKITMLEKKLKAAEKEIEKNLKATVDFDLV